MTALVPELVNAAIETSTSPADLLRRALVVARRLGVPELVDWISSEMNGYRTWDVPDYRRIHGKLMAEHPHRGLIPLIGIPQINDLLSDFSVRQSLPELIQLTQSNSEVCCHLPAEIEYTLMKMMREASGVMMRPVLSFSTVQVNGVIENVRSRILEWALDLETKGVLGSGMTFSQEEKQMVQQQHYHFGDVSGSQIQIGSNGSNQSQTHSNCDITALKPLIELLQNAVQQGQIAENLRDELVAELATLQAQANSPKPKWPVIKATLGSIKAVLENAAGSMIATQALPMIATFL